MCTSPAVVRVADDLRRIVLGSDDLVPFSDDRREIVARPDDSAGRLSTRALEPELFRQREAAQEVAVDLRNPSVC